MLITLTGMMKNKRKLANIIQVLFKKEVEVAYGQIIGLVVVKNGIIQGVPKVLIKAKEKSKSHFFVLIEVIKIKFIFKI